MSTLTVHALHWRSGTVISIATDTISQAFSKLKQLCKSGDWTVSGAIPPGGFRHPYAMAGIFDWTIIGAVPGQYTDEHDHAWPGVWFRGQFYKRRDLEPVNEPKKNITMPAMVKYSRGANRFDPPNIIEDSGGDFKYVTLISFSGNSPVDQNLCKS